MSFVQKLNRSNTLFHYWIFLYTYGTKDFKELGNEIEVFPFSYFTPLKNRALPSFASDRLLDLNTDDDLDIILRHFRLTNVQSVSECNINEHTNIICLELENRNFKKFCRHDHMFFFTRKNPPNYYIDRNEFLEGTTENIIVPDNNQLKDKLKIHVPKLGCLTTKIVLNKVFTFLFNDLFETILNKNENENENGNNEEKEEEEKDMEYVHRKIENQYIEESEEDTSSIDSNDSGLSWHGYCSKHGLPTKIKEI